MSSAPRTLSLPPDVLLKIFNTQELRKEGASLLTTMCWVSCVSKAWRKTASDCSGVRSLCVVREADADDITPLLRRLHALEELELSAGGSSEAANLLPQFACRTSLTKLSVEGLSSIKGILACKDGRGGSRLVALGLRNCQIGDSGVSAVASRFNWLRYVDLSKTRVGDDGVGMMALMCDLKELSLREANITDKSLEHLASGATNLEVLDLSKCRQRVTDSGVLSLSRTCTKLKTLVLSWCGELTLGCLQGLGERLVGLESVVAAGLLHPDQAHPLDLSSFSVLTQLDISIAKPPWSVTDTVIASLCRSPCKSTLTDLRLVGSGVSERGVVALARSLSGLTSLDLTGSQVLDGGTIGISLFCPSLLVLRLNSCGNISDHGCLAVAQHLPALRELDMKNASMTDSGLAALCKPHKQEEALQVLSVAHCSNITPQGLQACLCIDGGCGSAVRVLNIAGLLLTRQLLHALAELPLLRWLNITDCILKEQGGSPSEGQPPNSQVQAYEYAAAVLDLPGLRMPHRTCISAGSGPAHTRGTSAVGVGFVRGKGFPCLETLHTDRCQGVGVVLRLVASYGSPSLRHVTLSGDEVLGADVLVLSQSCKGLSKLCLRKCSLDDSVLYCLRQKGVSIAGIGPVAPLSHGLPTLTRVT